VATFYETITAAVNYFVANGYSSETKLAEWLEIIRTAANADLVPDSIMREELRRSLYQIYDRLVTRESILTLHPGVGRIKLQSIKPKLHEELERRILASADLIRLNRERAIADTLQRFQGWATSVPPGGTKVVDRKAVKTATRKELTKMGFLQRRVAIDQGHKFQANLSQIVAMDGGAVGAIWHQHHTRFPRKAHTQREGKVFLVRDSWAQRGGLVKPGRNGYTDDVEQPGELVYCFPGDTLIPCADGVEVAYRRWYSGDLTEIITDTGKTLRATPNHPVLTPQGWVAIGSLDKGDNVIEVPEKIFGACSSKLNKNNGEATIAEIFTTLRSQGMIRSKRGHCSQFHGDGTNSDVDIVYSARPLTFGRQTDIVERLKKFDFALPEDFTSGLRSREIFFNDHTFDFTSFMSSLSNTKAFFFRRIRHALQHLLAADVAHGFVGVGSHSFSFFGSRLFEPSLSAFRSVAHFNVRGSQDAYDRFINKLEAFGDGRSGLSGLVGGDDFNSQAVGFSQRGVTSAVSEGVVVQGKIIGLRVVRFSGHVYNLQTSPGYYIAGGIASHNCRCTWQWLYRLRNLPPELLTKRGAEELARVQAMIAA